MVKVLACRDVGVDCDWVGRAETEEELMRVGAEHLKTAHNKDLSDYSPEEIERIKGLIKEE